MLQGTVEAKKKRVKDYQRSCNQSLVIVKSFKPRKMCNVEFSPTIEGVNMQNFQEASIDQKVEMIPTKLLEEINLGPNALIFSDKHTLFRKEPEKG